MSAIRLMHIVMVTKPEAFMENQVLKDIRTKCISLFFKSLTSRADQVSFQPSRGYPRSRAPSSKASIFACLLVVFSELLVCRQLFLFVAI